MKRLLILLALLVSSPAWACEHISRLYGTQTTVDFCLFVTDATVGAVKLETAAHASGDTYLMKDEAAEANTTNAFTDEGSCYSIVLTASEMTAARITLNIEDQGTKTWADKCITIDTYGNASAQHGVPDVNVASITDDAIGAADIAASAIGASELAADAIGASELAADAIGASELAASAIGASELATDAIDADAVAADAVTEIGAGVSSSSRKGQR